VQIVVATQAALDLAQAEQGTDHRLLRLVRVGVDRGDPVDVVVDLDLASLAGVAVLGRAGVELGRYLGAGHGGKGQRLHGVSRVRWMEEAALSGHRF